MFRIPIGFIASAAMLCGAVLSAEASEIRYQPINPAFGGNPFNSQFLLGTADGQNDNEKPSKDFNSLDNFESIITSSLLSRISQDIADQILGENAKDSGKFAIGSTVLTFNRQGGIITINIVDNATGKKTTVQVPAPVF